CCCCCCYLLLRSPRRYHQQSTELPPSSPSSRQGRMVVSKISMRPSTLTVLYCNTNTLSCLDNVDDKHHLLVTVDAALPFVIVVGTAPFTPLVIGSAPLVVATPLVTAAAPFIVTAAPFASGLP